MSVNIQDADGSMAGVDNLDNALVIIDAIHAAIHKGLMYQSDVVNETLGDPGNLDVLVRVPAGKAAHLRSQASVGGNCRLFMYQGPTVTDDGTAVARHNRNLFSSNESNTLVFSGPTTSALGTLLPDGIIPGGIKGAGSGAQAGSFEEWVLPPGDYLVRLTNISGGVQPVSIALDWYEPVKGEPV